VALGALDDALILVRRELQAGAVGREMLRIARDVARLTGEISLQRQVTDLELARWPSSGARTAARLQLGRWRETSLDWWPSASSEVAPPARQTGRILHVLKQSLPHRQSGYSVRSMYLLRSQRAAGLQPVAVTALDFPATDGPVEEEIDGVRHVRLLRTPAPGQQPADRYLDDWAKALTPVAAREEPEVIHVHSGHRGFDAARVALAVGRQLQIPVVYEVRGFFESLWSPDMTRNERGELYERRRAMETDCMERSAAVVTLSESMREEILERGIDPAKVTVVPNGVDPESFVPRPRSSELRRRWGLDGMVFGYVSNLDHYREGQELLVDAAVELRARGLTATALIVGDGSRRAELEEYARRTGAGGAAVFTGAVPHAEVLDHYALMDAFVVPRVDERAARLVTPLKPYEAMALGVPLVVSDLPALREVIGDGRRGRAFRAGDAGDLARALEALTADPAGAAGTAATARRWVLRERSWSRYGELYREIYARVSASQP